MADIKDKAVTDTAASSDEYRSAFREYAEAILVALLMALVLRAYSVEAFKIPSGSMLPTLLVGDHLLVNKMVYGFKFPFVEEKILVYRDPARYDVIVFKYPENPSKNFIKRVIGIGGDVMEIKDKVVYINGEVTDASFTRHSDRRILPAEQDHRDNYGPVTVPMGSVLVLGDNRDDSHDSRYWGFVDNDIIKGKAMFIYWSWDGDKRGPRLSRIGRGIK